jgi:hypothetical protein
MGWAITRRDRNRSSPHNGCVFLVKLWSKNVSALFCLLFANRIRFILTSKVLWTDRPLSAVFCIGFVFGYGVRALISQIRRQQVRRLRQYRSFLTSSPRMLSEEQQAARTTV